MSFTASYGDFLSLIQYSSWILYRIYKNPTFFSTLASGGVEVRW